MSSEQVITVYFQFSSPSVISVVSLTFGNAFIMKNGEILFLQREGDACDKIMMTICVTKVL